MPVRVIYLIVLGLIFTFNCQRNEEPVVTNAPSLFQYLLIEEPINLRLTTNLARLADNSAQEIYQPATLEIQKPGEPALNYQVEIRPRGITRRKYCNFPPLKIKFKKSELKRDSLSSSNDYKLVTHCQGDSLFDQLILKEHMVYKLYNALTDRSFKSQLLRITYVDSAAQKEPITRYGFFIESEDELAGRLGGQFMAGDAGLPNVLEKDQYKLYVYFQYMIGNTDWNLGNRHNNGLLAFAPPSQINPYPIPYDFDYCGLVNAPYAQVFSSLPIKHVRERYMMWRGKKDEDFTSTIQQFRDAKPHLLKLVTEAYGLSDSIRTDAMDYLNSFFAEIEKAK